MSPSKLARAPVGLGGTFPAAKLSGAGGATAAAFGGGGVGDSALAAGGGGRAAAGGGGWFAGAVGDVGAGA